MTDQQTIDPTSELARLRAGWSAAGRKGGERTSARKARMSRLNGRMGGRPKKEPPAPPVAKKINSRKRLTT